MRAINANMKAWSEGVIDNCRENEEFRNGIR